MNATCPHCGATLEVTEVPDDGVRGHGVSITRVVTPGADLAGNVVMNTDLPRRDPPTWGGGLDVWDDE